MPLTLPLFLPSSLPLPFPPSSSALAWHGTVAPERENTVLRVPGMKSRAVVAEKTIQ
jgi:hypothetical protein